jgi:hypothetical protein
MSSRGGGGGQRLRTGALSKAHWEVDVLTHQARGDFGRVRGGRATPVALTYFNTWVCGVRATPAATTCLSS